LLNAATFSIDAPKGVLRDWYFESVWGWKLAALPQQGVEAEIEAQIKNSAVTVDYQKSKPGRAGKRRKDC